MHNNYNENGNNPTHKKLNEWINKWTNLKEWNGCQFIK